MDQNSSSSYLHHTLGEPKHLLAQAPVYMGAENKVLEGDRVITFCLMVQQTSIIKMEKKNQKKNHFELRQIFCLKNNMICQKDYSE